MKNKLLVVALVIVTAATLASLISSSEETPLVTDKSPGVFPSTEGHPPVAPPSPQMVAGGENGKLVGRENAREAEKILKMRKGAKRSRALAEVIAMWIRDDPENCMAFLESLGRDPARRAVSKLAIGLWVSADRAAALDYVEMRLKADDTQAEYLLEPVLEQIAVDSGSLKAVAEFMQRLPATPPVLGALVPVYTLIAKQDVNAARHFAISITEPAIRKTCLEITGAALARNNGVALLEDTKSWQNVLHPEEVVGVLSTLLLSSPEATLAWLRDQPRDPNLDVIRMRAARSFVTRQPDEAIRVSDMIADPALRQQLSLDALTIWATRDYEAAMNWAASSHYPVEALSPALVRSAPTDSVQFHRQLSSLPSVEGSRGDMRVRALVFAQWARNDAKEAAAWLASQQFSPTTEAALRSLLP